MEAKLKNRIFEKINSKGLVIDTPFPTKNLLIEVTNFCNNKCIFCYNDHMKRYKRFIDEKVCKKVLVEAYDLGMREVGFYVVGEPLLDKRLSTFIFQAKKIGYDYIYLTTNGILANFERIKSLYENGLNSIKFSINAFNAEDYFKIHGTNNFENVMNNLTSIYNWKTSNKKDLKIYVSFITTILTNNEGEIIKLFENKCDEFIIMPAINQGGLIPDICNISTKKQEDINGGFTLPCSYPFNSVILTVEGYLTACCMDFENLLAYADLNNISLKEAWNNTTIRKFRNQHLTGNVSGTICENCIYNSRQLSYPLNSDLCELKINKKNVFCKRLEKVGK